MDYRLEQLRFELREDPSSRIFFKLGETLRREGEFDEAIEVLSTGLDQHPRYVAAWVSYGRTLLDKGLTREAADALRRALDLDPENAVACRHAGAAAIANHEWVEAIKNLKRARAMSAPDEQLDEQIELVEAKLAERGQLEVPEAAAPSSPETADDDQVFAVDPPESGISPDTDDVFDSGSDAEPEAENGRSTVSVPLAELPIPSDPNEIFDTGPQYPASMFDSETDSEIEPVFDLDADALIADDSGINLPLNPVPEPADDAASPEGPAATQPEPEAGEDLELAEDAPTDGDLEVETMPLSVPDIDREDEEVELELELDDEVRGPSDGASESVPADRDGVEAEGERAFELETDHGAEDQRSEELPLPTMTLARLALDQGDLDLAEKTLRGVLARDPDHSEAAQLLAGLGADHAPAPDHAIADATGDARAQALRRWLEAVRLASERLKA